MPKYSRAAGLVFTWMSVKASGIDPKALIHLHAVHGVGVAEGEEIARGNPQEHARLANAERQNAGKGKGEGASQEAEQEQQEDPSPAPLLCPRGHAGTSIPFSLKNLWAPLW